MTGPHLPEAARLAARAMPDTLPVAEVFGPTLQGEGPHAGRVAVFVRLMGCNLSCSWCDTPYTWDATRHDLRAGTTHLTAVEIAARMVGRPGMLVLTGGEPLLHQHRPAMLDLLTAMHGQRRPVHVETNGTIAPTEQLQRAVATFVVSPKLTNAGRHRGHQDPRPHPAWASTPNAVFKFVCHDERDVADAVDHATSLGITRDRIWVMPEGTTPDQLAHRWPVVAAAAAQHGVNATHRLHVLAWGDERGH
mgnify:CR=1 FL=1